MLHDVEWVKFCSVLYQALDDGATIDGNFVVHWDVSHRCQTPYEVILRSSAPPQGAVYRPIYADVWYLDGKACIRPALDRRVHPSLLRYYRPESGRRHLHMYVPCRKCETCLRRRGSVWKHRAQQEFKSATRVWFCTYTVRPDDRFVLSLKAGNWDFKDVYSELSKEFTKYLKRLRHKAKFRYLLVAEEHKDGFPHLHALLFERGEQLKKRDIQAEWKLGFSSAKLSDLESSIYVCKYLTKSNLARVRASLKFGRTEDDLDHRLAEAYAEDMSWYNDPNLKKLLKED